MKRKKTYKSWEQAREEIENALDDKFNPNSNELCIEAGLQLKNSLSHFPSPIFSVAYYKDSKSPSEYYLVNYVSADSGESFIAKWKFDPQDGISKINFRYPIRNCLKNMLWIPSQFACIGYCEDMTIRGFTGSSFEEKFRLTVHRTILSMIYLEDFDEVITGGQGFVMSWKLRVIAFGLPIEEKEPLLECDINFSREWVRRLSYDKSTKTLLVLTDATVYVVSMVTRTQVDAIRNTHDASLTYCTFYRPYSYFITAARNGSIHVYHTAAKALIHTFSGHRDGTTGVASLSKQPILISWSQTSGCLRMWRLDTLELTSETTLSESILDLQVVRNDRLVYRTDSDIRIFDINVLFSVFATLSAPAESFRLCTIFRDRVAMPGKQIDNSNNSDEKKESVKFRESKNASEIEEKTDCNEKILSNSEKVQNGENQVEKTEENEEENFVNNNSDNTILDTRLVCVLDDRCIMGVSPVSGIVLNIIYPLPEVDTPTVQVDLENKGKQCYVVLADGQLMEFDCSVNPGQIGNIVKPGKRKQKVMSVVVLPVYFYLDEESAIVKRLQAVLVGLDNGYIKLYDGGEKSVDQKQVGAGGRRRSTRRKTDAEQSGPYLVMDSIISHFGEVMQLYSPFEGTLYHSRGTVYNILLSCGTDERVILWRATTVSTDSPLYLEMLMEKLKVIKLPEMSSCTGLTDNVFLFGYVSGAVEMYKTAWKRMESTKGAEIKMGSSKTMLLNLKRITADRDLCHRDVVTSVSESHLLQLFATTSKDKSIKIWTTDGHLIRELLLGDVVSSVCFANGRDLLASLRNHIVRMEAHVYLPNEYLEQILHIADTVGIVEMEPETPIPMEGSDGLLCIIQHGEEEEESDPFENLKSSTRSTEVSAPVLKIKRNRQTLEMYLKLQQEEDNEEIRKNTSVLKDGAPVKRKVDKAASLISRLDLEKMAKFPVAPDGFIPNSVVRDIVIPVPRHVSLNFNKRSSFTIEELQQYLLDEDSDWDLMKHISFESSSSGEKWSDIEDFGFTNDGTQWDAIRELRHFELRRYLKGRREEGKLEIVIVPKKGKPLRKKKLPEPIPEPEEEPPPEPREESPPPTQSPAPDKLKLILNELSRQMWCPRKIVEESFEHEFSELAEVLAKAGRKIALEMCHYLNLVHDVCSEKYEREKINLFTEEMESKFAPHLGALLVSRFTSCQKAAAEILSKFHVKAIKDAILSNLMPKFMNPSGSRVSDDPVSIESAAASVAQFASHIKVEDLLFLSMLIGVNDFRHTRSGEDEAVEVVTKSLIRAGVDVTDVAVWASFIIPLLPVKPPPEPKPSRIIRSTISIAPVRSVMPVVPETIEEPDKPETPDTSEAPETPELSEILEAPEVPDVLETPDVSEAPDISETSEAPVAPQTPEAPLTPETPEMPVTPRRHLPPTKQDSFIKKNVENVVKPPTPIIPSEPMIAGESDTEISKHRLSIIDMPQQTYHDAEISRSIDNRSSSSDSDYNAPRPSVEAKESDSSVAVDDHSTGIKLNVTPPLPPGAMGSELVLLNELRKLSTTDEFSLVRPVSVTSTLRRRSSIRISQLNTSRSRETNLRTESVHLVKLMRRASSSNTMHDVRKSTMRIAKQPSAIKALVEESSGSVESLSVRGVSPAKSVLSSLANTLKHSSTPNTLSRDSLTHLMSNFTPEAAMETPPPITTKEEGFVPPGSDDHQLSSNSTTIYPSRTLSHGDVTKMSPSLSSHPTEEEEESKWRDILKDLRSARISKSQQKIGGPTPHQKVQLRPKLPLIQSWQDRQQDSLSVVVCRPKAHSDKPAPQRRMSNIMRGVSRAMRTSEFVVARRRSLHDLGSKYVWKTPIPPVVIRDPVR